MKVVETTLNEDKTYNDSTTTETSTSVFPTGYSTFSNSQAEPSFASSEYTSLADAMTVSDQMSYSTTNTAPSNPEVEGMANEPSVGVRKSFSWKEKFGILKRGDSHSSDSGDIPLNVNNPVSRQRSAPTKIKSAAEITSSKPVKPMWKQAVDPTSGRVYYYHRTTRRTTWTKPSDEELYGYRPPESELQKIIPDDEKEEEKKESEPGSNLRKKTPRDFDRRVWKMKKEIAGILTTISPPNGNNVEKLINQYDGREAELLDQLKDMAESQPFDEPLYSGKARLNSGLSGASSNDPRSLKNRVQTATSLRSGFSGNTGISRISEKTELINNISPKIQYITAIQESGSHATSISSKHDDNLQTTVFALASPPRQIPVPRTRDLVVEELRVDRRKDMRGVIRTPRPPPPEPEEMSSPVTYENINPYLADTDDTDGDTRGSDAVSFPNDSVSALSETDFEYSIRQDDADIARRRALDDAITRQDWDLAAALSEGMRKLSAQDPYHRRIKHQHGEWKQSELDKFISEHDWDAVAGYIAEVRSKAKATERAKKTKPPSRRSRGRQRQLRSAHSDSESSNVKKRFGARSQLQHPELNSVSSWSSCSSSASDVSSDSYYSDDDRRNRRGRRGRTRSRTSKKNFAC
jgi:hypothetical protein